MQTRPTFRTAALATALLLYYAAVVGLHDWVQVQLVHLFHRWSFFGYEVRFVLAWYALFVPACAATAVALYRRGDRRLLGLGGATLLIIALTDHLWLATMSERVHYAQYGLLALGLRVLLGARRWWQALLLAALLGAADEAYQAFVLYADRPELPLDFKDMALNVIGAVLGLLVYAAFSRGKGAGQGAQRQRQRQRQGG